MRRYVPPDQARAVASVQASVSGSSASSTGSTPEVQPLKTLQLNKTPLRQVTEIHTECELTQSNTTCAAAKHAGQMKLKHLLKASFCILKRYYRYSFPGRMTQQ